MRAGRPRSQAWYRSEVPSTMQVGGNAMHVFKLMLTIMFLTACGDGLVKPNGPGGGNNNDDIPIPEEPTFTPPPFACATGNQVQAGINHWTIKNLARDFYIELPNTPTDKPVAVIFNFHGFGDTLDNWRTFYGFAPNGDPDFPFVIITPDDTGLTPMSTPQGLDWEFQRSNHGDDNREAALFEEVLGCLSKQRAIDGERVYTMGFSAGAITANMLNARYPQNVAATIAFSGAWFSDPTQVMLVRMSSPDSIDWDNMVRGTGAILISHGGTNDRYAPMGIEVLNFERAAQAAVPYLTDLGRTVLDCAHTYGHTVHPRIGQSAITEFFKVHRVGVTSPYASAGGSEALTSICQISPSAL